MLLRQLVRLLLQGGLLDLVLDDLPADHVHLRGHGVHLRADHGAGLIHQVDGLVGQEPVGDIPVRQGGGGNDGAVGDLHAVEHLVTFLQAAENGDGVLYRGLVHHDGLEPPLQGGVLLDILAVLVQGGGADAVQLAPGQHRLQQVAGVHAALGLARAHDGMQLVDEQDDPALRLLHFVQDGLQPLLKLAAVLGPGHQRTHIQGEDSLVLQTGGHVALHDPLGKALGDGGLAHAGLADQHGVVFALPGQDADHVPDLVVTADDGIQLVLPGPLHQVGAVLFQGVIGLLRVVAGHPLVAPHVGQGLHDLLPGDIVGTEQFLQGAVGSIQQTEEQVLHGDILVLHGLGGLLSALQGAVHILGYIDLVGLPPAAGHLGQLVHLCPHRHLKTGHGHAHGGEQLGDKALAIADQSQQQVLLLDLLLAVFHGQILGPLNGGQGLLGKLVHIHRGNSSFLFEILLLALSIFKCLSV